MSSEASCNVLHVLGDIFSSSEVDEVLRPGLQNEFFLASSVDTNNSQTDTTGGYLCSQMTEASRTIGKP